MSKILLIEDTESIRTMVHYELRSLGYQVTSCEDGEEGLELAKNNGYDLILIDWMLPNLSGIRIVEELRKLGHNEIMMMLTARDSEDDIVKAFELGVDDYLTKPFSLKVLEARIHAHLKRQEMLNTTSSNFMHGNIEIDFNRREVHVDHQIVNLTKKEFDLLEYLYQNMAVVLSRDAILTHIWDFSYDGDTRIVDVHIFKLRNKLSGADVEIKSNRGIGYILELK